MIYKKHLLEDIENLERDYRNLANKIAYLDKVNEAFQHRLLLLEANKLEADKLYKRVNIDLNSLVKDLEMDSEWITKELIMRPKEAKDILMAYIMNAISK